MRPDSRMMARALTPGGVAGATITVSVFLGDSIYLLCWQNFTTEDTEQCTRSYKEKFPLCNSVLSVLSVVKHYGSLTINIGILILCLTVSSVVPKIKSLIKVCPWI